MNKAAYFLPGNAQDVESFRHALLGPGKTPVGRPFAVLARITEEGETPGTYRTTALMDKHEETVTEAIRLTGLPVGAHVMVQAGQFRWRDPLTLSIMLADMCAVI